MKINIGSLNPSKIDALKETIKDYDFLSDATIFPINISSLVSEQPMGLEEIIKGALNRAKNSFNGCIYSVGLESGLIQVPKTKTGYMDICACAIYDGKKSSIGLSCAFEIPKVAIDLIKNENLNLSKAVHKAKLSKNPNIGYAEGIIGILTKGRVTRKDYTKQAIQMALIQIENGEIYK